jgi:AcrR family transcriptional regulator
MGITDRKEREKQEMRRLIIEAAMHMFLEEGYEKTSIRNIAEKIEYSPATIYLYYKDKDELLYEVQRHAFDQLYETFAEKAVSKSPAKKLEQLLKAYVQFGLEKPDLYDLMFIIRAPMNAVDDNEAWVNGERCFQFLLGCIDECMAQKILRFKDKMVAALSVWTTGHGLVSLNVRCRFKVMHLDQEGINKVIDIAIDEYLRMIRA